MSELKIRDPRDIILAPVVSEKSYSLLDQNTYTFLVKPTANKTEIKIAIEQIFGVKVTRSPEPREKERSTNGYPQAQAHHSGPPRLERVRLRRAHPLDP